MLKRGHRLGGKEFHWMRKSERGVMARVSLKVAKTKILSLQAWESVFLKLSG